MTTVTAAVTKAKPRVGGEIDAFCTKCKMDLNHRIIAMVVDDVKRVQCLTCHGDHNYRRPLAEREKEKERKAMRAAIHAPPGSTPLKSGPRTERGGGKLAAKQLWERSITGQPPTAFKSYNVKAQFAAGELIKHARFGDGVVARVIDAQKVEILFEDGPRTMAQAMQ